MNVERRHKQQVAYGLAMVCASILLFWLLPVLVWRNSWGFSTRFSILPGIKKDGGLRSGVVIALYTLMGVALVATAVVMTVGVPGIIDASDSGATGPTQPVNNTNGEPEATPTDTAPTTTADVTVELVEVPDSVTIGEDVQITAIVKNEGDDGATQEITLNKGDVDPVGVGLETGESETIEMTWTADDPGTHELEVASANETATATVEVLARSPEFKVAIENTNAPVADRNPLTVTANVSNVGTGGATQTVDFSVNGEVVDSTNVTLDSGASETTNLTWRIATPYDDHTVEIASANDTAATTVTVEPVEEPAVAGEVSVMTDGITAEGGAVHLYKQGEDDPLASEDLAPNGTFRFTDLDPGTTYELEIRSAVATHPDTGKRIGGIRNFPKTEYTFTAESIQQSADLMYGYEIRGAETYRWEFFKDASVSNRYNGYGRYNRSEAYVVERLEAAAGEPTIRQMIYLENKTFMNSTNTPAPVWYEDPPTTYQKPNTVPHHIVRDPVQEFLHLTRQFEGEAVVNGTVTHEYSISGLTDYPEATVYIDPNTGFVIKWESEHYRDIGADGDLRDFPAEMWFFDHNEEPIVIESPRED